jgi:hypothetical protein
VSKPRHRRPAVVAERQWFPWTLAAVTVPVVFVLTRGEANSVWIAAQMFALCLLSYLVGSLSTVLFLARSAFRPSARPALAEASQQPTIISNPAQRTDKLPEQRSDQQAQLVSGRRTRRTTEWSTLDGSAFLSTHNANEKTLDVMVLISAGQRPTDPADGVVGAATVDLEPHRRADPIEVRADVDAETSHRGAAAEIVEPGPYPGSVLATADGGAPDSDYSVKGNTRSMLYHTEQSPYFRRTKANVWFRSPADAEHAGFAAWSSKAQLSR